MKSILIGGIVALALSASSLAAQQPQAPPRAGPHPAPEAGAGMPMMMDSLDHRLDSLVGKMNRASGNATADMSRNLVPNCRRRPVYSSAIRCAPSAMPSRYAACRSQARDRVPGGV